MINKVILVGRLVADPEQRSEKAPVAARMATSDSWTGKDGEKKERTEFHRLAIWGKSGDALLRYGTKGATIYVEGRIQTATYTDKDAVERKGITIIVSSWRFVGPKQEKAAEPKPAAVAASDDEWDGDLPF